MAQQAQAVSGKEFWIGTTPMTLLGMLQAEGEMKLEDQTGLFGQGRWWATMGDGVWAGGQIAWRYHFRSVARGFFVAPYLDMTHVALDATDGTRVYEADVVVLGGHWGGRYTFDGGAWIGFRLGAGYPVKSTFKRSGEKDNEFLDFLDRGMLRPALMSYSVSDVALSIGWAL